MTTSTLPAPVKGLVFEHARRKNYDGTPLKCRVTSVTPELVYWQHPLYPDRRFKTKVKDWATFCAAVVSAPEPTAVSNGPKLTATECRRLHLKAHAAGLAAGDAAVPVPMVVVQHANPLDDTSPITRVYPPVMDGPCGFAYVKVRPGTSSFARFLRKRVGGYTAHYGGTQFSVREYGQSVTRKAAYAQAYAEVLREAGIRAYAESRLD